MVGEEREATVAEAWRVAWGMLRALRAKFGSTAVGRRLLMLYWKIVLWDWAWASWTLP